MRKPENLLTDLEFLSRHTAILATRLHVHFDTHRDGVTSDLRARMFKDYAVRALDMQRAAIEICNDIAEEQVEDLREEMIAIQLDANN